MWIVFSGITFAGMDSTAKFLVTTGVPVLLVIWARYVFQTVAVFFILLAHMRSLAFLKSRRPWLQFFRACALFGATMMFYNALKYIPLADGTAVVFLAPVMVTVLSGLFLGEHIDRHRWMAVAIAFAGVMVVVRPGSGILGYHALLPLGTALLTAIYFVMTRVLGSFQQERLGKALEKLGTIFGGYSEWGQPIHQVGNDVEVLGMPSRRPETRGAFRMLCRHNRWVQEFGKIRDADEISRREKVWQEVVEAIGSESGLPVGAIPAAEFRRRLGEYLDETSFTRK